MQPYEPMNVGTGHQLTADAAAARTGWVGAVVTLRLELLLLILLLQQQQQHLQLLKLVQQLVTRWNHLVPCRLSHTFGLKWRKNHKVNPTTKSTDITMPAMAPPLSLKGMISAVKKVTEK